MGEMMNWLFQRARRFLRSERGNVAMMFGLALVPMVVAAGVGLDYARSAVQKSQMADALDAAALAVGSSTGLDQAGAQALAQKYFNANYTGDTSNGTPTVTVSAYNSTGSVTVNASYNLPTTLLKVLGQNTVAVTTSSTVVWGQSKLWVSLVLDNTGSMSQTDSTGTSKITALKSASHQLLTVLQNASSTAGDVQVAIVPFARDVNIGTGSVNASWIDWTDWEAPPPNVSIASNIGPGDSCPFTTSSNRQMSPYGYYCTTGSSNGASTTSNVPASGLICPGIDSGSYNTAHNDRYYNGCYDSAASTSSSTGTVTNNTVCTNSNSCTTASYCSGYPTSSTTTGGHSSTTTTTTCACVTTTGTKKTCTRTTTPVTTTTTYSHTWQINSHSTWGGCIMDRTQSYDTQNTAPSGTSLFPAVNEPSCPNTTLMTLNYNWTNLSNEVDAMSPNGSTNQTIGLAHGWQALTSGSPYSAPALPTNTAQYIILVSDGLNTQDRWYGDGSNQSTSVDNRMALACTNAKAAGIVIYTIFVDLGGTQGNSSVLQNCASDSSKYFDLTTSNAIISTFNQIAQQITAVRVSH